MKIQASKHSHPKARKGSVLGSIWYAIDDLSVGDKMTVESAEDVFGEPVNFNSVRMNIDKVKNATGRVFATRIKDGVLQIHRVA